MKMIKYRQLEVLPEHQSFPLKTPGLVGSQRENAMAANIIFLRPVLLYAKIDNANKRREKTPVAARITLSILSYHSSSNNSV